MIHVSPPFFLSHRGARPRTRGRANHVSPPFFLSQRDSVSKPRVAARRLPWGPVDRDILPQRGCVRGGASIPEEDATPLGLMNVGRLTPRLPRRGYPGGRSTEIFYPNGVVSGVVRHPGIWFCWRDRQSSREKGCASREKQKMIHNSLWYSD